MTRPLACGVRERRSDRDAARHVITYLTVAPTPASEDDYLEVATKVTGSLDRRGRWNVSWSRRSRRWLPGSETVRPRSGRGVVRTLLWPDCRRSTQCPSSTSFRVTGLAIAHSVTAAPPPDQPIPSAVRGGASRGDVDDGTPTARAIAYEAGRRPPGATSCAVGGEDLPRLQPWDGGSALWRRSLNSLAALAPCVSSHRGAAAPKHGEQSMINLISQAYPLSVWGTPQDTSDS